MSVAETIRVLESAMWTACALEKMSIARLQKVAAGEEGRKRIYEWQRAREGAF